MRGRKPKDLSESGARNSALRALSRREHSSAQIQRKLEQRGFDDDTADAALEQLRLAGWQSDARFAEMLVRNRIEQGYGPQRIRHELEQAGVSRAEASVAMQAAAVDWAERCAAWHQRRFGAAPESAAEWQKRYRYLASRGFETAQIRAVLKGERELE